MDKQKIKTEAKQIMDNFIGALSEVEVEENFELIRNECFREDLPLKTSKSEMELKIEKEDFKARFLANAKKTKGDAILSNKGSWV